MEFELSQLKTFYVLAQQKNFTRAAEKLFITQSAVSHAIKKLEASIGKVLFDRHGPGLNLTDSGLILFTLCETVFCELERTKELILLKNNSSLGTIRLGSTIEFGTTVLVKNLAAFLKKFPNISIDLTCKHEMLPLLLRGELDIIIDCINICEQTLEKTPLLREEFLVVASPDYLTYHPIKMVKDLESLRILSLDKEAKWWNNFLMGLSEGTILEFKNVMAINHIRGIINAAIESIGIALLPKYCILKELENKNLVNIFPKIHILERQFYLYQKKKNANLKRHQLFIEYIKNIKPIEFGV